jgi:DNA repair protein RadD
MFTLRDYQIEAVEAGRQCLTTGRNGIIVVPTGGGKSLIIAALLSDLPGKSLVLQPSKEILEQNKAKTEAFGFRDIGVWSASCGRKDMGKITFATIGSIKRKEQFADFSRIVVDECHGVNSRGGQYEQLITELGLPTIGLTATPYRLRAYRDSYGTGKDVAESRIITRTRPRIFDRIAHVTQVSDLFRLGFLCPLRYATSEDYNAAEIQPNTGGGFD